MPHTFHMKYMMQRVFISESFNRDTKYIHSTIVTVTGIITVLQTLIILFFIIVIITTIFISVLFLLLWIQLKSIQVIYKNNGRLRNCNGDCFFPHP